MFSLAKRAFQPSFLYQRLRVEYRTIPGHSKLFATHTLLIVQFHTLRTLCITGPKSPPAFAAAPLLGLPIWTQFKHVRIYSTFRPPTHHWPLALRTATVISGGFLVFWFIPPIFLAVIGGALGYGVYRLIRRAFDDPFRSTSAVRGFPQRYREDSSEPSIESVSARGLFDNIINGMLGNALNAAARPALELQQQSINRIKEALVNGDAGDELMLYLGTTNPSFIQFSPPHSFTSGTLSAFEVFGSQATSDIKIEFMISTPDGKIAVAEARGIINREGEAVLKELSFSSPEYKRSAKIPVVRPIDHTRTGTFGRSRIIEGEFRDVNNN